MHRAFVVLVDLRKRYAFGFAEKFPRWVVEAFPGVTSLEYVLELQSILAMQKISRIPTTPVMLTNEYPVFVRRYRRTLQHVDAFVFVKIGQRFARRRILCRNNPDFLIVDALS